MHRGRTFRSHLRDSSASDGRTDDHLLKHGGRIVAVTNCSVKVTKYATNDCCMSTCIDLFGDKSKLGCHVRSRRLTITMSIYLCASSYLNKYVSTYVCVHHVLHRILNWRVLSKGINTSSSNTNTYSTIYNLGYYMIGYWRQKIISNWRTAFQIKTKSFRYCFSPPKIISSPNQYTVSRDSSILLI